MRHQSKNRVVSSEVCLHPPPPPARCTLPGYCLNTGTGRCSSVHTGPDQVISIFPGLGRGEVVRCYLIRPRCRAEVPSILSLLRPSFPPPGVTTSITSEHSISSTVDVEIRDPEPRAEYFTGITVDCGWKSCYLIHVGRPSLHRIVIVTTGSFSKDFFSQQLLHPLYFMIFNNSF